MASPWRALWRKPLHRHPNSHSLIPATAPPHNRAALSSSSFSTSPTAPWHTQTAHPSSRVQIYTSRSHNPFLNLSAEHFLLQHSHPDSTVLFLYTNDPCVVIGRNQNPWLEVNLGLLKHFAAQTTTTTTAQHDGGNNNDAAAAAAAATITPSLVRRRSGGGAVFHDRGNANFSVISPPATFDRNTHALMITRALHSLGEPSARVNARHDIVISSPSPSPNPTTTTKDYKISGSAYKLTRLRSLHHGTCLLSSPHLADIGRLLRAPAQGYIKARGVESVRSAVQNVGGGVGGGEFAEAVRREFASMYGPADLEVVMGEEEEAGDFACADIQRGVAELTSPEWIYDQTPQFTFSTHPTEDDPRERPARPLDLPSDFRATLTARHGEIQEAELSGFDGSLLKGQHIHSITDWRQVLKPESGAPADQVGRWFNLLFGNTHDGLP